MNRSARYWSMYRRLVMERACWICSKRFKLDQEGLPVGFCGNCQKFVKEWLQDGGQPAADLWLRRESAISEVVAEIRLWLSNRMR